MSPKVRTPCSHPAHIEPAQASDSHTFGWTCPACRKTTLVRMTTIAEVTAELRQIDDQRLVEDLVQGAPANG